METGALVKIPVQNQYDYVTAGRIARRQLNLGTCYSILHKKSLVFMTTEHPKLEQQRNRASFILLLI